MERGVVVLGISADFHDSSASLVIDGSIVAAAEEERFSRVKHDAALPRRSVEWCLQSADVQPGQLSAVAFYEKPLTAYERLLVTMAREGPRSFAVLARSIARWSQTRLWIQARIDRLLSSLGHPPTRMLFAEHHESHAAAAFYPSPFDRAAVLTFDGVGEWVTTSISRGDGNTIEPVMEQRYPDSLGLLYSTMTAQCGFPVNDGEQKLMALAPFGRPTYLDALSQVVDVADDGSIRLDTRYFGFQSGRRMGTKRLDVLLDGPPRNPELPIGQREADIARSTQDLLERVILAIASTARELTGERRVCVSGGVALNCVANGRLVDGGPFEDVWVQPAAGDSGSSLGAALWAWYRVFGGERTVIAGADAMRGGFLGPSYSKEEAERFLLDNNIAYSDPTAEGSTIEDRVTDLLEDGAIVGWFAGRMEFGPRALGHRSILADPRSEVVASHINRAIKRRDSFQPFAPAVMLEQAEEWFETAGRQLPYMAVATRLHRARLTDDYSEPPDLERGLTLTRSELPACTHVDLTARVQTVDRQVNPEFHRLLEAFNERTGCPVLLNTSFNGRGEPIVCSPADALRAFHRLGLDALALEGLLVLPDTGRSRT